MNFLELAQKRLPDLLPGERNLLWGLYHATEMSLLDLAYSPNLKAIARGFTNATALEVTPGEAYHLLKLLGAY